MTSNGSLSQTSLPKFSFTSVAIALAVVFCIAVILLPLDSPENSLNSGIPQYLHVSLQLKVLSAFILGKLELVG